MNFAEWNQGLLLSAVRVIAGGMLLVGASSLRERLIAIGTLSQAIVLAFVTNGAFHERSDLPLAAIALASLCVLWSGLVTRGQRDVETTLPRAVMNETSERGGDSPPILRASAPRVSEQTPNDASHATEER